MLLSLLPAFRSCKSTISLDTEPFCISFYHENPLSAREGSHPLDTRQNCIVFFTIDTELFCLVLKVGEDMNESITTQSLHGKNVVVIGGSKGVGRAIVAAAYSQGAQVLAVARQEEPLLKLADDFSGVHILGLDATDESAPAKVFETLAPDVLVVCAGAIPHTAPLGEQSWEQFSRNWNSDVKMSLLFSQAALATPLASGTTIILISSGAAVGGSPMSGGYAGSKRTQMFLANYAQKEADRLNLGLRFLALAPGGIMPGTDLGKAAVEAYASYLGIDAKEFIKGMPSPQTPEDVANAVVEFASNPTSRDGNVFLVSGKGIETLP
jgi:NAD(P)-dependent dehydrogenase (short-subunit alcohol dehydrogenase family)